MTRLSICIATFKRAAFIRETLESIAAQAPLDVEILVLDGASPDDTEAEVGRFAANRGNVRYIREETNSGIDIDYDKAVQQAVGEYCWLMSDDDLLLPDAILQVLAAIDERPDVIVVDAEVRDSALCKVIQERRFSFEGRRTYTAGEHNKFLADLGDPLSFIGGTICRRAFWQSRDRSLYYGSLFIHVGVLFQAPPPDKVIALGLPLIAIRFGNSMWTARSFEIWMLMWPRLIWSLTIYSPSAKRAVVPEEPWRDLKRLIIARASGGYTFGVYRSTFVGQRIGSWRFVLFFVALLPARLLNTLAAAYLWLVGKAGGPGFYQLIRCSPNATSIGRAIDKFARRPSSRVDA